MQRFNPAAWLGLVCLIAILFPGQLFTARPVRAAPAAILTVTSIADSGPGSLRQAIQDAPPGSVIRFSPSLAGSTIVLVSTLEFAKDLEIDGSGLNPRITISGNKAIRIFYLGYGSGSACDCTISLKYLILKDGKSPSNEPRNSGGALFEWSNTNLFVSNSTFIGNSAYEAGAIYSLGDVTVQDSVFTTNSSWADAGAIYAQSRSNLTIQRCIFTNNTAAYGGGALELYAAGVRTIEDNLFENNSALTGGAIIIDQANSEIYLRRNLFSGNQSSSAGGAIYIDYHMSSPALVAENNTFFDNHTAASGGAIYTRGLIILNNNTFSGNSSASSGGSLYVTTPASLALYNNIIADTAGGGECVSNGNISTEGANNIVEDGSPSCKPSIIGDPGLAPLANNGGFTHTMAIGVDSLAFNAGADALCPGVDQRGVNRPWGAHCDIGAFELIVYSVRLYLPALVKSN
jgi:predicted outer membrane repeat protein